MWSIKSICFNNVNRMIAAGQYAKTLARSASSSKKQAAAGNKNKPKVCAKDCSGLKVPNQKETCFPANRFPYRNQCLKTKYKTYKRVCAPNTAWATEPKFEKTDFRVPYPVECPLPPCCLAVRTDDTLYKSTDKDRVYQQTWSECVKLPVDPVRCPPLELKLPELEKRKVTKVTETARAKLSREEMKSKCPYLKVPCCIVGRKPPLCKKLKKPSKCAKKCCPYPSFSECCLSDPLPPAKTCECGPDDKTCLVPPPRFRV